MEANNKIIYQITLIYAQNNNVNEVNKLSQDSKLSDNQLQEDYSQRNEVSTIEEENKLKEASTIKEDVQQYTEFKFDIFIQQLQDICNQKELTLSTFIKFKASQNVGTKMKFLCEANPSKWDNKQLFTELYDLFKKNKILAENGNEKNLVVELVSEVRHKLKESKNIKLTQNKVIDTDTAGIENQQYNRDQQQINNKKQDEEENKQADKSTVEFYELNIQYAASKNKKFELLIEKLKTLCNGKKLTLTNFQQGQGKPRVGTLMRCICEVDSSVWQDKKYLSQGLEDLFKGQDILVKNLPTEQILISSKISSSNILRDLINANSEDIPSTQTYYLSEQEFKLIDLDDLLLDYQYTSHTSDCDDNNVKIEESKDQKYLNYTEESINTSVINVITYANQNTLKVNGIGLLSNATLITFIDDASAIDTTTVKSSTHLKDIQFYPIPNQDVCQNLKKTGYNTFLFECEKIDPTSNQHITTLYQYNSDNFSNANGIDLTYANLDQALLDFDPKFAFDSRVEEAKPKENGENDDSENYQIFLNEYNTCIKDTGFYFNSVTKIYHYFRVCKYHETLMSKFGQGLDQYIEQISSFFELYDLNLKVEGRIQGISPKVYFPSEPSYKIKTQGVQQVIDDSIIVLDFDEGLLFFTFDPVTGQYANQDYFIKYFYDQKYFNLFLQKNQDIEFTIQDSIPNFLVVNTQMYLIMYQLNETSELGMNTFPQTVSISHFIHSVQDIHKQNKHSDETQSNKEEPYLIPDIKDINSFSSIRYNFDQYLYYIEIKFREKENQSYFLLINRALTDHTNSMKMNSTAIEMDYQTNSAYSKIFHYPIPGLFYSNIRTRVRLFELGVNNEGKDSDYKQLYKSGDTEDNLKITTYSWKSAQVLKLYTKQFDQISKCIIHMLFKPNAKSVAVGTKEIIAEINLIPRNFQGIISKQGSSISQKFFNPKPVFEIKDWFFGPGINYDYQSQGPNNNVSMTISNNSTTLIDGDSTILQNKATSIPSDNNSIFPAKFGSCSKIHICDEKLVAAIQVGNDYYIFYQNCICLLWFDKCTLKSQTIGGLNISIPTQSCKKSQNITLSMSIDQIIFDGNNIIASSFQKTNLQSQGDNTNETTPPQIVFMQVTEEDTIVTTKKTNKSPDTNRSKSYESEQDLCQSIPKVFQYNGISQAIKSKTQKKIFIKKNYDEQKSLKEQNKGRTSGEISKQFILHKPKNINLNVSLENIQHLSIFCIPNTVKYGVVIQSNLLPKKKIMSIFSIQKTDVSDYTQYEFQDVDDFQDSYDVSLLDQGIMFASRNMVSAAVPGLITIYKVNFITKKIYVDRVFTQADMINQIQRMQNIIIKDNVKSVNNGQDASNHKETFSNSVHTDQDETKDKQQNIFKFKIDQMKLKNLVFITDTSNFMNNFSVKVWRNDDSQTYRFLLIDYDNNCLFDYYLYDLIKPIFIRQVNLYDFQITPSQQFQITNNMMCLHVTKNSLAYLISLQINGESIDQLRKIELQEDKQSYSQVQQALGTPYTDGTICGVFSLPSPVIKCIYNPSILLNFDFSQSTSQSSKFNEYDNPIKESTSDKEVDFKINMYSDLDAISQTKQAMQQVILHTNFSNFDTNLIKNSIESTQYFVKNATILNDDKKQTALLNLDSSFVKGSIEQYYVKPSNSTVRIQGYIDTNSKQNNTVINNVGSYHATDRNPYQLVSLMSDSIIVINQNLKFNFEVIYKIKYSDIRIKKPYMGETIKQGDPKQSYKQKPENIKLCRCNNIYSSDIQRSQTTTSYLYILLCNIDSTNQTYITFNVDVNHFSSLEDQKQDWEKAMSSSVRQVNIHFAEEDLESMITQIKTIQIISLIDDFNNIAGYIFMMVRLLTDPNNPNAQPDNTIYILWADKDLTGQSLDMYEIEQINSADFSLNYISVSNFIASFPYAYPNQIRMNPLKKQDFVFNIGWDDQQRYVILALLKLSLPPDVDDEENYTSVNQKEVFNPQFVDIYDKQFSSFIKMSETYLVPFTELKSTITFQQDSYNASVIITNEFSIIEFAANQSPFPYIPDIKNKKSKKEPQHGDSEDQNGIGQVILYTQYAWCNNKFNVDNIQQAILKYDKFLIINCAQPMTADKLRSINSILKVYKINSDNEDDSDSSDSKSFISHLISYLLNLLYKKDNLQKKQVLNKTSPYSMVQSIQYSSTPITSISSMSFRQDNQALFLDLILSNGDTFELFQYPVNQNPQLLVDPNIQNNSQVSICTKNKYPEEVCNTAIFVNPFIDVDDQSKKQWFKFVGLVAFPLFLSLSIIFVSFVFMKKLRKSRQDEFIELLKNQSMAQYKSKSDISFIDPIINENKNEQKYSTNIFQQENEKNQQVSVSDHALFTFNDTHLNASTELR